MKTGTCKVWKQQGGYGFVTLDDGGPDLFCHWSAIQADGYRELAVGDRVRVLEGESNGRRCAISCMRITDESPQSDE